MAFDSKCKSILVNLVSNLHDNINLKLRTCFNWKKKSLRISNHHEDWPRPDSPWVSPTIATGGKERYGLTQPELMEFPTYPWNIPQTLNQPFMKEFFPFGGGMPMLQEYVGVLLD